MQCSMAVLKGRAETEFVIADKLYKGAYNRHTATLKVYIALCKMRKTIWELDGLQC